MSQKPAMGWCLVALTLTVAFEVAGAPTITKITDTAAGYTEISAPTANSGGNVAFNARTNNVWGIHTGEAGGQISHPFSADGSTYKLLRHSPSINDVGQLAFVANGATQFGDADGAFRWSAGAVTPIHQETIDSIAGVAINNAGLVYFTGVREGVIGGAFFASGSGGLLNQYMWPPAANQVSRPAASAAGPGAASHRTQRASPPISRSGVLVNSTTAAAYDAAAPATSHPQYTDTDNPPLTPTGPLDVISAVDVDSSGKLIFVASFNAGLYDAVFTLSGQTLTRVQKLTGLGTNATAVPAINDNGILAALLTDGTERIVFGHNALNEVLIAVGQPLDNSLVTDLTFVPGGLSEGNQLAFKATLADAREGVYIAQVPEPAAPALFALATPLLSRKRR